MRLVVVGLVLLALAIASAEYVRRTPRAADASPSRVEPKRLPPVLETAPPGPDAAASSTEPVTALLGAASGQAKDGFSPVLTVSAPARALKGGFGAVLFLVEVGKDAAIVRAEKGEAPVAVAARQGPIDAFAVDGSTAFFAQKGRLYSVPARGGEPPEVWVDFPGATITSLAPSGDTVFVTVEPVGGGDGAVASVRRDGTVALIKKDQEHPRAIASDGKDVVWISGAGAVWRAPVDGSFASRLGEGSGPLALDGDAVVLSSGTQLKRLGRSGAAPLVLADTPSTVYISASGLVRFADDAVREVTAGAEPSTLFTPEGQVTGLAIGGTTLYVLVQHGQTASLWAR